MNNILFNLFLYFKFYFCTSDATSNHTQSQSISTNCCHSTGTEDYYMYFMTDAPSNQINNHG